MRINRAEGAAGHLLFGGGAPADREGEGGMRRRSAGVKRCSLSRHRQHGREHRGSISATGVAITTLLFHASLNQIGMSKHGKNAPRERRFRALRKIFGCRGTAIQHAARLFLRRLVAK
jgi:hypothetical protein